MKTKKKRGGQATGPSKRQMTNLVQHWQNARFNEAQKLALWMTKRFSNHPFGWKVLGMIFLETGQLHESLIPTQKAIDLSPQDAAAHNNLGVIFQGLDRLDEAKISLTRAIELKPDYAEAHYNLGITFQALRKLDSAQASYSRAIALQPYNAEAHFNLGTTFQALGKLNEAEASLRHAITLKSDYAVAHNNLGNILRELGKLDQAETSLRRALALTPDFTEAYYNLGLILQELRRFDEAQTTYMQAITLKPDFAEAYYNLGMILHQTGRVYESLIPAQKAVDLSPQDSAAHNNLGVVLQQLGRFSEAEASYMRAIALTPDYAEAHRLLALLKQFITKDSQYLQMLEMYLDESISEEQRCHINFGLAKANEDLENYDQAFTHYKEGNALRKQMLKYNSTQDEKMFKRIKSYYPQIENLSLTLREQSTDILPIFILGMPRSGTTLVEQIVSSHPNVTGAGELFFTRHFGESIANGFTEVTRDVLLQFRQSYLDNLKVISEGNLIITDKMPLNFRYIGLLSAAFPEAKFIHVKRDPAAVCWANFKQYFVSEDVNYCYAIDDVVNYYKLYKNLMDFWLSSLSTRVYNLDYELLTVDQERQTRKLIKYLGLAWHEAFLSPQNNSRGVATASNIQVRKKLYTGSSEKWRNFQPFLNGAFNDLLSTEDDHS